MRTPFYPKLVALSAILLLWGCSLGRAQTVTTYDRSGWVVSGSSQELSNEGPVNGRYAALLDGNNTTYWSSQVTPTFAPFPHRLVVDMGVIQPVNQLSYVQRQDSKANDFNTVATIGSVSFSDNGTTFGPEIPVNFAIKLTTSYINLPTVQNHRYFRITFTQNRVTRDYPEDQNPTTAMAEIGAIYNTTLAAKLATFTTQATGTKVDLKWTTSLEQNGGSYTVTRSVDGLNNFTTIGTVPAAANTNAATNYTFTDATPLTGTSFYRLEMTSTGEKSVPAYAEYPAVTYSSNQPKNLTIFYFIPSDLAAPTDFKARMDTILVSLQTYFGNEVQRNGRGYKTFGLVTDATHQKVKLIVINGKLPKSGYPREDASRILTEVEAYILANPSPFYSDHNLIMLPAYSIDYNPSPSNPDYDPDGIFLQGPFGGIAKNCYAMDYDQMKQSNLGKDTRDGRNSGKFIGGLAHEIGHGLNLDHNERKVSEAAALGTLLMEAGNYTYGKSKTSLSATDAAILNHNQVFNDASMSYYGPTSSTIKSIHACYNPVKKAIIVAGRFTNTGAPVTDVAIYNDPANGFAKGVGDNNDYDAVTWTAPVIGVDSFYIEEPIAELQVNDSSLYEMKIKLIQLDGNTTNFKFAYNFHNNLPDLTDPAFKPISATLTASAGPNGTISPAGATVVSCTADQTYTITANTGYVIENVLVDGVQNLTAPNASTFSYTFTNAATNHTISATFKTSAILVATLTASATTVPSTGTVLLTALAGGGRAPYSYTFEGNLGYIDVQNGNTDELTGLQTGVHTFTVTITDSSLPTKQTATATVSFTVSGGSVPVVSLSTPTPVVTVGGKSGGRLAASATSPLSFVRKSANARIAADEPDTDFAIFHFSRDDADERLEFDYTITGSATDEGVLTFDSQDAFAVGEFAFDLQVFGVSNLQIDGDKTLTFTLVDQDHYDVNPENDAATITFKNSNETTSFSITDVTTVSCTPVAGDANRRSLTFTPQYSGTNGQPISFSVANEMVPTTAPGPYTLSIYLDNPTITLKATQTGTTGEVVFAYNWLSVCGTNPPANTPPTVANAIPNQSATVGVAYSYMIPANTFTDAQTPASLVVSVSGLPAGLTFTAPATISGTPSISGTSMVTVTATDPGGLKTSTSYNLTVGQGPPQTGAFAITAVTTVSCTPVAGDANRRSLSFTPQYSGTNGQPISFSVANEMIPTTAPGPYTLSIYLDNPTITLKATQTGTAGEARFAYNWLAACGSAKARIGGSEEVNLQVQLLGNPIIDGKVSVLVHGALGQPLVMTLSDIRGQLIGMHQVPASGTEERHSFEVSRQPAGLLLLKVSTPTQSQTVKVVKAQ